MLVALGFNFVSGGVVSYFVLVVDVFEIKGGSSTDVLATFFIKFPKLNSSIFYRFGESSHVAISVPFFEHLLEGGGMFEDMFVHNFVKESGDVIFDFHGDVMNVFFFMLVIKILINLINSVLKFFIIFLLGEFCLRAFNNCVDVEFNFILLVVARGIFNIFSVVVFLLTLVIVNFGESCWKGHYSFGLSSVP